MCVSVCVLDNDIMKYLTISRNILEAFASESWEYHAVMFRVIIVINKIVYDRKCHSNYSAIFVIERIL